MPERDRPIPVPEGLSHGERVRWLLGLEPDVDYEELRDWRWHAIDRQSIRYHHLEIRRTSTAGFVIKVSEGLEIPVTTTNELVRCVDELMGDAE